MLVEVDKMKTHECRLLTNIGCTVKLLGSHDDHPLIGFTRQRRVKPDPGRNKKEGRDKQIKGFKLRAGCWRFFVTRYIKEDPSCGDEN